MFRSLSHVYYHVRVTNMMSLSILSRLWDNTSREKPLFHQKLRYFLAPLSG